MYTSAVIREFKFAESNRLDTAALLTPFRFLYWCAGNLRVRLFSPNLDKAALVHYRVQGYDLRG